MHHTTAASRTAGGFLANTSQVGVVIASTPVKQKEPNRQSNKRRHMYDTRTEERDTQGRKTGAVNNNTPSTESHGTKSSATDSSSASDSSSNAYAVNILARFSIQDTCFRTPSDSDS